MDFNGEKFLVTGAFGCIGAWVIAQLVHEQTPVVAFDAGDDARRLRLLLNDEELARVVIARGDIVDFDSLHRLLERHEITNIIHLAALQVPFCAASPVDGARVNVVGTVNVLEAARRRGSDMAPVVYASSIAAYDVADENSDAPSLGGLPGTLYGVYKRANEGTAQIFSRDYGVSSVGLRPHTVYGVGRDQGLTSAPTTALLAAAAGEAFQIPFGGRTRMQYAADVARAFVQASRSGFHGAEVVNLAGIAVSMEEWIARIDELSPATAGLITTDGGPLPFPVDVDTSGADRVIGPVAETPLDEALGETLQRFRELIDRGLVDVPARA